MLDYRGDQRFVNGLGDWSDGSAPAGCSRVVSCRPRSRSLRLRPMSRRWGYLDDGIAPDVDAETMAGELPSDDEATDEAMAFSR